MRREIYLNAREYGPPPNEKVCAWIRANGLDPAELPADQTAVIEDGNLTVTVFIFNKDRSKRMHPSGQQGYVKELRTVPLFSSPEDHNL